MSPERWKQIKEIFQTAIELPVAERLAFVQTKCFDDESLKAEVESMLENFVEVGDFIAAPAFTVVKDYVGDEFASQIGKQIGAYKIESELGRGGMGAVYLATRNDKEFEKKVAVKLIKRGFDTDEIIRRFRHERQILAQLEHPNITRLIDGGSTVDGLPFLVMDYVEGLPLIRFCNERRLTIDERLQLFLQICAAVFYAHQNLVVHRDLKPSNILVTNDGTPKLLDFGIAKLTLPERETETFDGTATRVMTPEYASPEQILGQPVTTATDVYSLGVLLYEMLSGKRPFRFQNRDAEELSRLITDSEPLRPSEAAKSEPSDLSVKTNPQSLKGDLDNIVLMAMRKEPTRRYGSVEQFADDIRRHLAGLPVIARADTFGYRFGKFVRRNKTGVAAATGVAVSLVAGIVATSRQAQNAAHQKRIAERERDKANTETQKAEQINHFLQEMLASADPRVAGRDAKIVEVLNRAASKIETDFSEQPEIAADLHTTVGRTYLSLGLFEVAERHLQTAFEIRLRLYGRDSDLTAQSLNDLGKLLKDKGDFAKAEPLFREAYSILFDLHGDFHADTATVLNNIGHTLLLKGDYRESVAVHRKELAIRRDLFGENHHDVAQSLGSLASSLAMSGETFEAEQLLRKSLEILRETYGEEHLDVALAIDRLAHVVHKTNPSESEVLFRRELAIHRKILGGDHPLTAWTIYYLANLLNDRNQTQAAAELAVQVLDLRGKSLSDEHPVVASALQELGRAFMLQEKPEKSEPLFRESLSLRQKTLPENHWLLASSSSILGECLAQIGHQREAFSLLESSCENLKNLLGAKHEQTRRASERLVRLKERR